MHDRRNGVIHTFERQVFDTASDLMYAQHPEEAIKIIGQSSAGSECHLFTCQPLLHITILLSA